MKRSPLFVAFSALTLFGCSQDDEREIRQKVSCQILVDFVEGEFETADRDLLLSDEWVRIDDNVSIDEWYDIVSKEELASGISDDEIRAEIKETVRLSKLNPIKECPSLRAIKTDRSHVPTAETRVPQTTNNDLFYHYDSLAVQVPFVDLKRGKATFEVSRVCGPLCASGSAITYRRDDKGVWHKQGEVGTWIS